MTKHNIRNIVRTDNLVVSASVFNSNLMRTKFQVLPI